MYEYEKKSDKSVLYRHVIEKHSDNEEMPKFKAKMTGT